MSAIGPVITCLYCKEPFIARRDVTDEPCKCGGFNIVLFEKAAVYRYTVSNDEKKYTLYISIFNGVSLSIRYENSEKEAINFEIKEDLPTNSSELKDFILLRGKLHAFD